MQFEQEEEQPLPLQLLIFVTNLSVLLPASSKYISPTTPSRTGTDYVKTESCEHLSGTDS